MNLPAFCIRRPAFTLVITFVIMLVGLISFTKLPLRWIPRIEPPVLTISTKYSGASPSLVENQISKPIEKILAGVNGIDTVTSTSRLGSSRVMVQFKLDQDINTAMQDVQNKLQLIKGSLPESADTPVVSKADLNSEPILFLSFADSKRRSEEVNDYLDQFIKPSLEGLPGVGSVLTYGERHYAMRLWLDPQKMAAHGVTVQDVNQLLRQHNVEIPSGQITTQNREYTVMTNSKFKNADSINHLIVRADNHGVVRIGDIGYAEIGTESSDSAFRVDGKEAIAYGIVPLSNANPLQVSQEVKAVFARMKKQLPASMEASVAYDKTLFTQASLYSVGHAIVEASLFVMLVVIVFLGCWRAGLIPIVTIPVCLLGSLALLAVIGYSINTITLLAMVLAIGLVVDDAIVMVENIMRRMEEGEPRWQAALEGSREMIFPIIGMTITLAAVYFPVGFSEGVVGKFLREFAFTLAGSVLISGVLALTLSPMLCARLLRAQTVPTGYQRRLQQVMNKLIAIYGASLRAVLAYRRWVLFALVCVAWSGYLLLKGIPHELAPFEDMGAVQAYIIAPPDSSFKYTDARAKDFENVVPSLPDVEGSLIYAGAWSTRSAFGFVMLNPWEQRKHTAFEISEQLRASTTKVPGANYYVSPMASPLLQYSGGEGNSLALVVKSPSSYEQLYQIMERLTDKVQHLPQFVNVKHKLAWESQQFEIQIDRERAADQHLSMGAIHDTIRTLLAGQDVTKYQYEGNEYNLKVKTLPIGLNNAEMIQQIYVRNERGDMIPIANIAKIVPVTKPLRLDHYARMRSDTLTASLAPGHTVAEAIEVLTQVAAEVLPENAQMQFEGQAKQYLESSHALLIALLLGIVFIYLTLTAQFESFIDPVIILLTVPFALIGALLTLKLVGASLNIYSQIGLITLIGLIAKHGILITEFANRARREGVEFIDAIVQAGQLRIRPILITTAAMVLGAIPLAWATGPGAEVRQQLGWTIVGGLLVGTLFSLYVVPVAYSYLGRLKKISDQQAVEVS